ncbi:MAG: hypothetical protein PHT21_11565 [Lachnospiraceae bacterium]|nr:hypothetical protein [Lachnospiraceae bacterium]
MRKVFKWNNHELYYSALDAEVSQKFVSAFNETYDKMMAYENENVGEDSLLSFDGIRIECGMINDFFDKVFGEGTAEKLFDGRNELEEHVLAMKKLKNLHYRQGEDYAKNAKNLFLPVKPNEPVD